MSEPPTAAHAEGGMTLRVEFILSAKRALIGEIDDDLRGIAFAFVGEREIQCRFIYDCPVTLEIREVVALVETYVIADLEWDVTVEFRPEALPRSLPCELQAGEEWLFLRRQGPRIDE